MFRTLAFTGLRRGELLALQWKDISFKDETISVTKTLIQPHNPNDKSKILSKKPAGNSSEIQSPKSKAGIRVVPIDATTLDLLRSWKNRQRKVLETERQIKLNQLVFTTADNKRLPLPQPGKWLDSIINKINSNSPTLLKRITPHGFRHTFATLLYESDPNITPKDVQKILGHDTIQVTMDIYTHATREGQKRITDSLNSFMNM